MRIKILTIILFISLSQVVFGQSLSFRTYTTDDGLNSNTIYTIFQDSKGYIWFGTESGVSRFDGNNFINYTIDDGLIPGNIRVIFEDSQNVIWFGGTFGISKLVDGKFEKVRINPDIENIYLYDIAEDFSGNLWFATRGNGLYYRTKDTLINQFHSDKVPGQTIFYNLQITPDSSIYIATLGEGVLKIKNFELQENYNHLNSCLQDSIYTLFLRDSSEILMGAKGFVYSKKGEKLVKLPIPKLNRNYEVRSIIADNNNKLWLSNYGSGFASYDGKYTQQYSDKNGLPSNMIQCSLRDFRGDLWFGTRNGVVYLPAEMFWVYDKNSGLKDNIVYSIEENDKGDIYFGHDGDGVSILLEDGSFKYLSTEDGLCSDAIASILFDSQKGYWFGTDNGVTHTYHDSIDHYSSDSTLTGNIILSIFEDSKNEIWLGGEGGATRIIGDSIDLFTTKDGLPPDWIYDIFEDDEGDLWFGSDEGGVSVYDGNTFHTYSTKDGLPVNQILSIEQDKYGNYWFGTDGAGLVFFDGKTFKNYKTEDGLSGDICYGIIAVRDYLYVSTNDGITRIEYRLIEEKGKSAFQVYSKDSGLPSSEMTSGGLLKDSAGNLWFASHGGVIKIDPSQSPNLIAPPIFIQNIRILEGSKGTDTLSSNIIDLNYSQNNIKFDFVGISYALPEKLLYNYKLEGIADTNWSETRENSASYPFLPPGDYVFKVKAKNNDGMWSPEALAYIRISPPIYSTWWFSALLFIFASAGIYGFYLFKTQQVKKRNLELANTVREKTKDLQKEKNKSDELLLNILPQSLVDELKLSGHVEPKEFKNISILFTDFKGFTYTSSVLPADKLVKELNDIFKGFDEIIEKYKCEKLKTIGDAYMAGAGLPVESDNHAIKLVMAAKEMHQFVINRNEGSAIKWEMRAGVHSGNVIAGVVGTKKFTYDIWGDTVNIASRMESSGAPGEVNVSAYTYMLIKDYFNCEYRGKVDAKGKGKVDMYFVREAINDKIDELNKIIMQ